MIGPGIMAVLIPLVVGILFGVEMLGGLLAGSLVSGVPLALLLANAGGAWDNAKKYIETGTDPELGGKGSPAHKAAVVGDTVGDPFKDTSGPALNILLKLMAIVSLVFAPLIMMLNAKMPALF
jgi:K(+)-stimulated pyrophosphate-energized sodium pump